MSINFNATPSTYFQNKFDPEDISKSATAGDTRVENAILYGNANLLKAMDMAEMLEKTAGITGAATEYTGQQIGNTSMFTGAMEGLTSLGYGAYKAGHFGGGPEGAPPSGAGGSDTDVRSWLTPNVP